MSGSQSGPSVLAKISSKDKGKEVEKEKAQLPRPAPIEGLDKLLVRERIYLAEGQFPAYAIELLSISIQSLGGTISPERAGSTVLLVNPASTSYNKEVENPSFLRRTYPDLVQFLPTPYTWLAYCRYHRQRFPLSDLPSHPPIFVHPDRSREHAPLKVWVSVNVHKTDSENAYEAQAAVTELLEKGGAVIVEKRKHADMLIVDRTTNFFTTVSAEQKKYGRDQQRNVERDWVENAVKNEKMLWPKREGDMEGLDEDGVDSMAEDIPLQQGRGPGRPTGKARIEYSREDDDFLCRYLAAHHPSGSWHSRKTYQTLTRSAAQYPIASRHSDQSWHERFKKSAATFSKAIERYIAAEIDGTTLKTKAERAKTARLVKDREQAERERHAAQVQDEAGGEASRGITAAGPSTIRNGATRSEDTSHVSVAEREGARLTELAARAVESIGVVNGANPSSNKENVAPATVAVEIMPLPQTKGARLVDSDSEDEAPPSTKASELLQPQQPTITATDKSIAEPKDIAQPPIPTVPIDSANSSNPVNPVIPATQEESQDSRKSNGHVPDHILKEISHSSPKKSVRMDLEPVSMDAVVSHRARSSEPPRPPGNLHDHPQPNQPRQSLPATMSILAGAGRTPQPSRLSQLFSTPTISPSLKRSRVQEEIMSSASKRHRAQQRAAFRGSVSHSNPPTPDTVLASTHFPPRQPTPSASAASSPQLIPQVAAPVPAPGPAPARNGRKGNGNGRNGRRKKSTPSPPEQLLPPPPLTEMERNEAILAGQRLVLKKKEEYKQYVHTFCLKYGLSPTQLYGLVNELPKRIGANSDVYWADVEGGLKEKFGF